MIGQNRLKSIIKGMINNDVFPRFSIFTGAKGIGKKTFVIDYLPTLFSGSDITYVLPDVKVDTIRDMITQAYTISTRTFYIIPDADSMSLASKNAILKVTEEPPNNAYFIMTVENLENVLDTVKSRGSVFIMEDYSFNELLSIAGNVTDAEKEVIKRACNTPLDIKLVLKYGAESFYNYVCKVVDNIAVVSGSNSFKIADKIAFKGEEDKYDLSLFWRAFMSECIARLLNESDLMYCEGVRITGNYLADLRISGINKQATFDNWLLDIRGSWM